MSRSGKVNPVSVLLLLAIAAGTYWLVFYVPLFFDDLDVREAADIAFTNWRLDGEEIARMRLFERLNDVTTKGSLGWHYEVDEEGVEKEVPGLGVKDEDVTFTFDERTKILTVRVRYDRVVEFPPSKKRRTFHFEVVKRGEIK